MATTTAFTPAARERFLALLAVGYSVEAAAAAAGTSRTTVARWAARGRAAGASAEHRAFAERLDAVRAEGEALLVEQREAERVPVFGDVDYVDEMTALEPDAMALLTPEQRERAMELCEARHDAAQARAGARARRNGGDSGAR